MLVRIGRVEGQAVVEWTGQRAGERDAPPGPTLADAVGGRFKPVAGPARKAGPARSTRPTSPAARIAALPVDEEQVAARGWMAGQLAEQGNQGLAVTYRFDLPTVSEPSPVAIRFTGVRVEAGSGEQDRFERVERVDGLTAQSGNVTVTAKVEGLHAGRWRVVAEPDPGTDAPPAIRGLPRRVVDTRTVFADLAHGPGVHLFSWPILVGLGALVAIFVQVMLAARAGLPVGRVLALSATGCLVGFVGGKAWFLALHHKSPREFLHSGACIQGFLLGACLTLVLGAWAWQLPPLILLNLTAPGVLLGMAVGRPGCFLTGCCVGRPTTGWGLWSSDRRIGIRRIPVQLVEAAGALVLGVAALAAVLIAPPAPPGALFVAALAGYTGYRQVLFPLRVESRTALGRAITAALCGLAAVVTVAWWVFTY